MTKQKAAVLNVIRSTDGHMTAAEIFDKVKEVLPDVVLATVYNNLNALENEGEIRRLRLDGTADRFDKSFVPHAHIVCSKCGRISDAPCANIIGILENALNIGIDSFELKIDTVCDDCKK